MVAIRVDANEHIASGHVMRCLSVADALFLSGEEVVFLTADETAAKMITSRGHKAICLGTNWQDKEGETDILLRELSKIQPNVLLLDSYQVTPGYMEAVKNAGKLAYIDDLDAFDYPADIVINYSIYANDLDYPKNKTYLLGMGYAPLRAQFDIPEGTLEGAIQSRRGHRQILVTTGAADPFNISDRITEAILGEPRLDEYDIAVIRGRFAGAGQKYDNRVRILENVENMADIMLQSSMAVSAGGSTLYELCACAVPTVTFSSADNQSGNVQGFAKRDLMPYAGDIRPDREGAGAVADRIVQTLLTYSDNDDIISGITEKMIKLDCRKGAKHLAKELAKL